MAAAFRRPSVILVSAILSAIILLSSASNVHLNSHHRSILLDAFPHLSAPVERTTISTSSLSISCGSYVGITCDKLGHVTAVDFTGVGLSGPLPTALFQIFTLQKIQLGRNSLSGSIPESIGNLRALVTLELYENSLAGSLPKALGKLTALSRLNLARNRFSGTIPREISGAVSLTDFDVSVNSLTGPIPASLGSLSKLSSLFLQRNGLNGSIPPAVFQIKSLQQIDLSYNSLQGPIPSIAGLASIDGIILANNLLSGSLPQSMGKLALLTTIDFSSNKLSGPLPASLGTNPSLREIQLSGNSLSGVIPSSIGNLANLQILDLSSNSLAGPLPAALGNLKNLLTLNLGRNSITGPLPPAIGNANKIIEFDLSFNKLTGPIPATLSNWGKIQTLYLYSNNLSGAIPATFGSFPDLVHMDVSSNQLTGTIPRSLKQSDSLQLLSLGNNSLSGHIPLELSTFLFLESLDLHNNNLTGPALSGTSLLSLDHLDLSSNYFGDSNFTCLSTISGIRELDLSGNCFPASPCTPSQRSSAACSSQCNAMQASGSCAGFGTCVAGTCACDAGYVATLNQTCVLNVTHTAPSYTPTGLKLTTYFPASLSRTFRFIYGPFYTFGTYFSVRPFINWADYLSWANPPSYNSCAPSWAVAAKGAMDAAYAVYYGQSQPSNYSLTQLVECTGPSSGDTCSSGSPLDALQYASTKTVLSAGAYVSGSCKSVPSAPTISHFEEVSFVGITGMIMALQRQPVVAFITANCPAVISYQGGIFGNLSCQGKAVDQAVVIVGYNVSSVPPYWLLRNSWGPNWGENGYMRLQIGYTGPGILNINTLPGYIPVFRRSNDLCETTALAATGTLPPDVGNVNPCGSTGCNVTAGANLCKCGPNFLALYDPIAKAQVCVPNKPCSYFPNNPCIVGSCINGNAGNYMCLCPLGYVRGKLASNGQDTCIPGQDTTSFTVPAGFGSFACDLILQTFGIRQAYFIKQNPKLNCSVLSNTFGPGTTIDVTAGKHPIRCSVWYPVYYGDTCAAILTSFNLTQLPNPDLSCNGIFLSVNIGQQYCVAAGKVPDVTQCSQVASLPSNQFGTYNQTCAQVVTSFFNSSYSLFFTLNPGINCNNFFTPLSVANFPTATLCLATQTQTSIVNKCGVGKTAPVALGQTCQQIYTTSFNSSSAAFAAANSGAICSDQKLYVGAPFCHG